VSGEHNSAEAEATEHPHRQALLDVFHSDPWLAPRLVRDSQQIDLGLADIGRVTAAHMPDLALPQGALADVALPMEHRDGRLHLVLVLGFMHERDEQRRFEMLYGWSVVRYRYRCNTRLAFVSLDRELATWCHRILDVGPDWKFRPLSLGPQHIPVVTDPAQARAEPALAALSALAHGA
jgi:hypothetical protein